MPTCKPSSPVPFWLAPSLFANSLVGALSLARSLTLREGQAAGGLCQLLTACLTFSFVLLETEMPLDVRKLDNEQQRHMAAAHDAAR